MRAWLPPLLGLMALLAVACGDAAYSLNRQGNQHYAQGDYTQALEDYRRAQVQRPDLPQIGYNIGNTLHRQGDYRKAVEEGRRALFGDDPLVLARAYYSLGNHYFRLGLLREARTAYKNALIHNPDDLDAKFNLEVVLLMLRAASRQDQEPQPTTPEEEPPPTAGEGQQPAEEEPTPAQPTPTAEDNSGKRRDDADSLSRQIAAILGDQEDREFSVEEALRLLDLLAQQQRQRQARPATAPSSYRDW